MTTSVQFYTNPMSRAQIARWMLHEVGASYEQHLMTYGGTMKADDYLAINPMGKVPAIVHQGHVVTECAAICAYLADAFPGAGLAPPTEARADYYRWLFFAAGPLEAALTNHAAGFDPTEEQGRMFGYGSYEKTVAVLEGSVARGPYLCGEAFTAADVYVGAQVIWGLSFGTLPKQPAFQTYAARLTEREPYQEARAIDNDLIMKMKEEAEAAQASESG